METITRAYEAQIDSVLEGERSVVARINTGCVDEYRTIIDPAGGDLKDFNANPPVLWQHGKEARGSLPIGRGWVKARKSENDHLGKCFFAKDDFSQQLYEMYKDGTLRGWSINMVSIEASAPTRDEIRARPELERCEMVYRRWKLKEFSAVAIPGNTECLTMLVSRGMWTPPEGYRFRTATESQGMATDGALVDDNEDGEERAATHVKGKLCPPGECKRCDKMRVAKERTAPFVDTDGSAWWVSTNPEVRFCDARLAQECLGINRGAPSIVDYTAIMMGELRAKQAANAKEIQEYVDLYRYGHI